MKMFDGVLLLVAITIHAVVRIYCKDFIFILSAGNQTRRRGKGMGRSSQKIPTWRIDFIVSITSIESKSIQRKEDWRRKGNSKLNTEHKREDIRTDEAQDKKASSSFPFSMYIVDTGARTFPNRFPKRCTHSESEETTKGSENKIERCTNVEIHKFIEVKEVKQTSVYSFEEILLTRDREDHSMY